MSRSFEMGWPFIHAYEMGQLAPAAIEQKGQKMQHSGQLILTKISPNPNIAYKIFESVVAL